jgi:hypothetical protein
MKQFDYLISVCQSHTTKRTNGPERTNRDKRESTNQQQRRRGRREGEEPWEEEEVAEGGARGAPRKRQNPSSRLGGGCA